MAFSKPLKKIENHIKWFSINMYHPIVLLLGLAIAIHFAGVVKDLPYVIDIDETIYWVERSVRMASSGYWNPEWFGHPGSTILYPLAILYHLWFTILHGGDIFYSNAALFEHFIKSPSEFYIIGRLLTSSYAVLSLIPLYKIGKYLFGERVGLTAVWLYIWNPLAVSYAQFVRSDSAAVFWGLLSIYCILKTDETPNLKNHLFSGICIGLAFASRYFMIALMIVFLLLEYSLIKRGRCSIKNRCFWFGLLVGLFSFCAAFLISTPFFLSIAKICYIVSFQRPEVNILELMAFLVLVMQFGICQLAYQRQLLIHSGLSR